MATLDTQLAPSHLTERMDDLLEALGTDCENYHQLMSEGYLIENAVSYDELHSIMDHLAMALKVYRAMPGTLMASYLGEALVAESDNQ